MKRGQTFKDSDGQLIVLKRDGDSVQVAERYTDEGTVHWHDFWMDVTELSELDKGSELDTSQMAKVRRLVGSHPKDTPHLEYELQNA